MIAFSFFAIYAALLGVYALFLFRMRRGMQYVESAWKEPADTPNSDDLPSVTVLVPLRNESANIDALVDSLAAQEYPGEKLQVLIIDDHSDDGSFEMLEDSISTQSAASITPVRLASDVLGKKAAIAAGIELASGEIILTTDADCSHSPQWVQAMARPFIDDADVVAGPVVIADRSSLFSRLQAMDFLGLMGVGAGFFGIGFPRLCNGANFAYRKALFQKLGGFEGNEGMSSGDDEFLLHKIVYRERGIAVFTADSRAVVQTPAVSGLFSFLAQRSRWASKGVRYSDGGFVAFLVLLFVFYFFTALLPVVAFLSPVAFLAAIVAFLLKSWVEFPTLISSARLFQQPIRILDFIIAELLHPFYLVTVTIAGTVGVGTWKGRKLETRK